MALTLTEGSTQTPHLVSVRIRANICSQSNPKMGHKDDFPLPCLIIVSLPISSLRVEASCGFLKNIFARKVCAPRAGGGCDLQCDMLSYAGEKKSIGN